MKAAYINQTGGVVFPAFVNGGSGIFTHTNRVAQTGAEGLAGAARVNGAFVHLAAAAPIFRGRRDVLPAFDDPFRVGRSVDVAERITRFARARTPRAPRAPHRPCS